MYARRSGDLDFVNHWWPSLEKSYHYCESALDDDGLMSNVKGGAAAVETGALSGRVAKDVYLAGAWLAALDGFANLAMIAGHADQTQRARSQLEKGRASLNAWFRSDKGHFPFGRLTDGSTYDALSGWQSIAVAHGGLDRGKAARATSAFNRPELSTDWGVRLFATDSPSYDPLSYNDGSVWPFVTGFTMMAEYKNHRAQAALRSALHLEFPLLDLQSVLPARLEGPAGVALRLARLSRCRRRRIWILVGNLGRCALAPRGQRFR